MIKATKTLSLKRLTVRGAWVTLDFWLLIRSWPEGCGLRPDIGFTQRVEACLRFVLCTCTSCAHCLAKINNFLKRYLEKTQRSKKNGTMAALISACKGLLPPDIVCNLSLYLCTCLQGKKSCSRLWTFLHYFFFFNWIYLREIMRAQAGERGETDSLLSMKPI